ncbi:hypothetical protein EVAR_63736_1 [Eumeta japonica]|uniref:Uncharacterized protein n=1 Tax=Eumeta variegata TaxID=151549 RepID=A0A4C1ZD97_EUMVA|nr:hypothetical protein EVAR_63736_1 [Eumeta japonica]
MIFCRVEVRIARLAPKKQNMTGAVHAGTPRAGRRDAPQHATPTNGQDIIMCSDEFGLATQPSLSTKKYIKHLHARRLT